jgi:ATP-dependent Lon protease
MSLFWAASAAVAVSVACMLTGREVSQATSITGEISLS